MNALRDPDAARPAFARRSAAWAWRAPRVALIGAVRLYRLTLSPWIGNACRFEPTCSAYAIEALQRHGAVRGAGLAGWRLLRCHPFCAGGADRVPPARATARLFTASSVTDDAAAPSTTSKTHAPLP